MSGVDDEQVAAQLLLRRLELDARPVLGHISGAGDDQHEPAPLAVELGQRAAELLAPQVGLLVGSEENPET